MPRYQWLYHEIDHEQRQVLEPKRLAHQRKKKDDHRYPQIHVILKNRISWQFFHHLLKLYYLVWCLYEWRDWYVLEFIVPKSNFNFTIINVQIDKYTIELVNLYEHIESNKCWWETPTYSIQAHRRYRQSNRGQLARQDWLKLVVCSELILLIDIPL